MIIKRIVVGELEENCYIVEKNNECIIIDPGDEAIRISENITKTVVGILVTHHHFDHVGALDKMKEKYNITKEELSMYNTLSDLKIGDKIIIPEVNE